MSLFKHEDVILEEDKLHLCMHCMQWQELMKQISKHNHSPALPHSTEDNAKIWCGESEFSDNWPHWIRSLTYGEWRHLENTSVYLTLNLKSLQMGERYTVYWQIKVKYLLNQIINHWYGTTHSVAYFTSSLCYLRVSYTWSIVSLDTCILCCSQHLPPSRYSWASSSSLTTGTQHFSSSGSSASIQWRAEMTIVTNKTGIERKRARTPFYWHAINMSRNMLTKYAAKKGLVDGYELLIFLGIGGGWIVGWVFGG